MVRIELDVLIKLIAGANSPVWLYFDQLPVQKLHEVVETEQGVAPAHFQDHLEDVAVDLGELGFDLPLTDHSFSPFLALGFIFY